MPAERCATCTVRTANGCYSLPRTGSLHLTYVLASGIPEKGRVLTQLSLFWFDFLKDIVPNHLVTANVDSIRKPLLKYEPELRGRSMLVVRADMYPVECVVRGYLSGSGWKEYQQTGAVCGIELPKGMRESDKLPEPIFTPSTKAASGHDENISFDEMVKARRHCRQRDSAQAEPEYLQKSSRLCVDQGHHYRRYQV